LRLVGGKPLVARAVAAANEASSVDRVLVSTDNDAIADVARQAGAEVIPRPEGLSGDEASSESAVLHVLDSLAARGETDPEIVVMMQCTSPFTTPADVDGTVGLITNGEADCAFTAAPSHAFLWQVGSGGNALAVNHDSSVRPRRQDREPEFVETGAVYAMRTDGFRLVRHRFFGRIGLFEVAAERSAEIDVPADLVAADGLATSFGVAEPQSALPHPVAGLALDFDGVLTDNRVMTLQDGTEAVMADRSDGMGIEMLQHAGIPMVVISKERNAVVEARCRKIGLPCVSGVDDKATVFRAWIADEDLDPRHVVYLGNDVNDSECLLAAGCGAVVADAHPGAKAVADLVLRRGGGRGAVRELADLILADVKGDAS
jgi:N-acylneuraminate cytidylyltransferase